MGVIFLAAGLANKDKWKKKQKITPEQKKLIRFFAAIGVLLLLAGVAAFLLFM